MKAALTTLLNMKTILCYGDSLTAGTTGISLFPYAPHLQSALGDEAKVVHHGLPGWTAWQMLESKGDERVGLQSLLRRVEPDTVLILAGTNDLGRQFPKDVILANIRGLHSLCHAHGVETVAIGIPSSSWMSTDQTANEIRETLNDELRLFCENAEGKARFFPFPFDFVRNGSNWDSDGLHFSKEGYKQLGIALAPFLRSPQDPTRSVWLMVPSRIRITTEKTSSDISFGSEWEKIEKLH